MIKTIKKYPELKREFLHDFSEFLEINSGKDICTDCYTYHFINYMVNPIEYNEYLSTIKKEPKVCFYCKKLKRIPPLHELYSATKYNLGYK